MAARSAWSRIPFILAFAAIQQPARCDEFLAHAPVLQFQLASQIDHLFGEGAADTRVQEVEARLRSMYSSLPTDHNNRLGQQAVRYALHRYFSRFHGWSIAGLRASPSATAGSSSVIALDERTPQVVKEMVHEHLEERGFELRDLAHLAVMMELFVKMEVVERLTESYKLVGLQTADLISSGDVEKVINYNFILQILSGEGVPLDHVHAYVSSMDEIYPAWQDTRVFISDMRQSIAFSDRHVANPFTKTPSFSFDDVVDMAQHINDKFGHFQNFECRQLKDTLLEREVSNSGRIRLRDFYSLALGGSWMFTEKAEYLKELGALDDSDTRNGPSVIIANYLTSQSNCLASSAFYSICCLDECEDLLGHLEDHIAAPEAAPEVILTAVSRLPSSTVAAPRNISDQLVSRLHQVAAFHGGAVPLHGRLFAQWMHNAYPRECPYPHAGGTTEQVGMTEWTSRTAREDSVPVNPASAVMSVDEMQLYVHNSGVEPANHTRRDEFGDHEHDLPHLYAWVEPAAWSDEEELFAGRRHLPPWARLRRNVWTAARNVAMLAALGAVVVQLAQSSLLASSAAAAGAGGYGRKGQAGWEKLLV